MSSHLRPNIRINLDGEELGGEAQAKHTPVRTEEEIPQGLSGIEQEVR